MRFEVKFWWSNPEDLNLKRGEYLEDDTMAELSREHFLSLLEQGAFGSRVDVRFELDDEGRCIVATVKVDCDKSQSEFMQELFYKIAAWVIGQTE
ncbi:MAG: hypothetical protein COV60_00315 [Candidatus Magasanikbacteria bacterium CG11_big_fil_rev_8_21_14_0_20_43_7]|uniref:Uncharacterized protein n=1 Tax=Candidatus Magasanikbacteria bacterium CG11_big_fil_rev_8_21_14_0_20_43_7 TaxID=1974654 RepID=A0A2H0N3H4_9BACT|nr:MAG: hypothetical protein COV60_00315 [Candidatus Magasanikbacteria bacterium CG11_big_fil_rev_8_21_14_0_20_43_7]